MKSTYRNSLRSKKLIREAVITLLSKKQDISQISVSEIVKMANINRGTFYNHYNNIMDVLEEIENELFEKLNTFITKSDLNDVTKIINSLVEYFKANETVYKQILKSMSVNIWSDIKDKFMALIVKVNPEVDRTNLMFIVNGLSGLYWDYLDGRVPDSLDEIGQKTTKMINNLIKMK